MTSAYKDFKDYPQLIQILKDRHLIINDEIEAIAFLKNVHYYRLSAYFIPFQYAKESDKVDIFKPDTTFEDIKNLYLFDEELRNLVFTFLQKLELILRSQIAHIHAKNYGAFGYIENSHSLKRDLRIKDNFPFYELITQINKEKSRAYEDFIRHMREKYNINDLPIWALVEILSFGSISKFFKLMQKNEQIEILKFFKLQDLRINVFENWLETLSYIRNICAHHSRLWNKNFVKKFKLDKHYKFLNPQIQTDKIFYGFSVIMQVLKDSQIKNGIERLIKKYPRIDMNAMGFPQNWQNLNPWSKL